MGEIVLPHKDHCYVGSEVSRWSSLLNRVQWFEEHDYSCVIMLWFEDFVCISIRVMLATM